MYVIICWRLRPSLGFSGARGGNLLFRGKKKQQEGEEEGVVT